MLLTSTTLAISVTTATLAFATTPIDVQQDRVTERELFESIERNRERHLEFLRQLIQVSVDGEEAVQSLVASRFRELGAAVQTLRLLPTRLDISQEFAADETIDLTERISVVGKLAGTGGGRSLLFFAHPDGEPVTEELMLGWTFDPFAATVENGRIHGWGVADDLAGVAIMAEALSAVLDVVGTPSGGVILGSTPAKKNARGILALLTEGYTADAAVYLHPAESEAGLNDIKTVTSGMLQFRIRVVGQPPDTREPGQTAFAHLAENAIEKAMSVIEALRELDIERSGRVTHAGLEAAVGRSTNLLVSDLTCGDQSSLTQVPVECVIGVSVTFPPNERLDSVREDINSALTGIAESDPWLAENPPTVSWLFGTQGVEVPPEHPLFQLVHDAVRTITGTAPVVNPLHSASDIRNPMLFRGIPSVGLGPLAGDFTQAGGVDEWVDVEDYLRTIKVCAKLILEWCR